MLPGCRWVGCREPTRPPSILWSQVNLLAAQGLSGSRSRAIRQDGPGLDFGLKLIKIGQNDSPCKKALWLNISLYGGVELPVDPEESSNILEFGLFRGRAAAPWFQHRSMRMNHPNFEVLNEIAGQ